MPIRAAVVVALALLLGACSKDDAAPSAFVPDGSARVPDAAGVVVRASAKGVTLRGGRTYKVSPKLVAFSTFNLAPIQLASALNDFVHLGLEGETVVWLARIGPVDTDDAGRRTTLYQGSLTSTRGSLLYFRDGTVLQLESGLHMPDDARGLTTAHIDADSGLVRGAVFPPAAPTTTRPENL